MIIFRCECGRELQARDEDAGRKSKCPACGLVSVIPPPEAIITEPGPGARGEADERDARDRRHSIREDEPARKRRRDRERYRDEEDDDRSERFEQPEKTSGKATTSLVLGLLSFPCVFNVFTGLPAIIFGAIALGEIGKSRGRLGGRGAAIAGIITGALGIFVMIPAILIALLIPAVQKVREAAARAQGQNNLKQIVLAMHNFHDRHGAFPRAAPFRSADGKQLLSWRVALLPYIGENGLYNQFKLDEPWDSPNNIRLLNMIPRVYLRPGEVNDGSGKTHYQVFVGAGTIFDDRSLPKKPQMAGTPEGGIRIVEITDGSSMTILVAEGKNAVPWTKPEDLPFDPKGPLPELGGASPRGFNVAFADGSVRFFDQNIPEATLKAMITRNGGEMFNMP
jgi:prepilin-type processing-associated H-X9-DG protein